VSEEQFTLSHDDLNRLVVAMKNANAIAETLVSHGNILKELDQRLLTLSNLVQTMMAKQQTLESLYHRSLVAKYGTGPTTSGK